MRETAPGSSGSDLTALLKAVAFSAEKHRLGKRKDADGTPYINHPIRVATLLAEVGGIEDVEVLQAGILHDTIEDTKTTPPELEAEFGPRVRSLVEEVTDDKSLEKQTRKERQVEGIRDISTEARAIRIADKMANLEDIEARPPAEWATDRKRGYPDWTRRVVRECRGASPALEARYYRTFWRLGSALEPESRESVLDPEVFEEDLDVVTKVGWARGRLSGGDGFRLECWAEDGLTMLTYYFPIDAVEEKRPSDFGDFLEEEGLLRFVGERRYVEARRWTDAADRRWWTVNLVTGDESATYVDDFVPLRPYENEEEGP